MMENTTYPGNFKSGFSEVNGLRMYYEICGQGKPLVLIHGGGSTIQSSFGKAIPLFAKSRQVLALELQAHGRTGDRDTDLSFEQDADDIATLLKNLGIGRTDLFGFSNGATTALQVAIRHPHIVNKIVLGSALTKRSGTPDQFWEYMQHAKFEDMPEKLKEAFLKVSPNPDGLKLMFTKDAKRMANFEDIPDEKILTIKSPVLIISGDKDVMTPEHALEIHRLISGSELAILPGGHGDYIGEVTTLKSDTYDNAFVIALIEKFLDKE